MSLYDCYTSSEQRKSGTFKDNTRRKVRRNNENGVTTITNLKNHNIQEDIQFLRELNKLKAKVTSVITVARQKTILHYTSFVRAGGANL